MTEIIIPVITGSIGTAAFAVLYHADAKFIPHAFVGGAITTLILVLCLSWLDGNNLISNALAAFAGGMYSTLCAHHAKASKPVFMVPTLFPLVPGRNLYFSMIGLTQHSREQFIENFGAAAEISFGIAVGLLFAAAATNYLYPSSPVRRG